MSDTEDLGRSLAAHGEFVVSTGSRGKALAWSFDGRLPREVSDGGGAGESRKSMTAERDELFAAIDAAFPREIIAADDAFSDWGTTYLDAVEYRDAIHGRTWDELDHEYLVRRSDALGFLGTRALVAVLPVYLRSMVEDGVWKGAAGMLTIILRRPRTGPGPDLGKQRFTAFVEALSARQRTVIARVLQAFADRYDDDGSGERARTALDGFWRSYLPPGTVEPGSSDGRGPR